MKRGRKGRQWEKRWEKGGESGGKKGKEGKLGRKVFFLGAAKKEALLLQSMDNRHRHW